MILTDTCVLIDYFREVPEVTKIIKNTGTKNIVLNSIIVMEILAGARDKVELNSIKKRLNKFQILEINQQIMDDASSLMENFCLSHEKFSGQTNYFPLHSYPHQFLFYPQMASI